jgi:hypothetical protein
MKGAEEKENKEEINLESDILQPHNLDSLEL